MRKLEIMAADALTITNPVILIAILTSFVSTFFMMPYWIKRAKKSGLTGKDMNKKDRHEVAELGGVIVLAGFVLGVLAYLAIDTFYLKHTSIETQLERDLQIAAALLTIMIITIIGLVDDILGWKIGLRQWQKPVLAMFAALPMMVVNAGTSEISLPLFGVIDIGILFPLLVIPIAISGTANAFNMLAGYNGLEAGMGIIILSALGYRAWTNDIGWVAVTAFCMVLALLAFYFFNKYPAKIFPGNSMTYPVGALIAIIAILGNLERLALFLFIPYFIEFFLKLRGMMQKESFAIPNDDGSLSKPYDKFYGLEHVAISFITKLKKKAFENEVVSIILILEIIIAIIGLSIW